MTRFTYNKTVRRHFQSSAMHCASIVLTLLLVSISCKLDIFPTGSMQLQFEDSMDVMTLVPDIGMDIAYYEVSGIGLLGSTFRETTEKGSLTVPSLIKGAWTVRVDAFNLERIKIGTGSGSTTVVAGETVPLSITVRPLTGTGTVSLGVSWPPDVLYDATVTGTLVSLSGTPVEIDFSIPSDGSASAALSKVEAGYYTLIVQLADSGVTSAGAVEAVRVAAGATTYGNFVFDDPKIAGGSVSITIDPEMDDPLTVMIAGGVDSIGQGNTMTLAASVVENVSAVEYTWYLDGALVSTAAVYTTASSLARGTYRVDVLAFEPDQARSGSESHTFTVEASFEAIVLQSDHFTLAWDPPVEGASEIVEYNIYYRLHEESVGAWTFLDSISGDITSYLVTTAVLNYGIYDFAVTSKDAGGNQSEIHSSLDSNASPTDGWYLDWRAPV